MSVAYDLVATKDREEWLALRSTGIGSSDCAAAIGVDPYRSPYELWMEKTGLIGPRDLSDNEAVQTGTDLEEYVAQRYARKTGNAVAREPRTMRSRSHPFMLANIDRRVIGQQRGLECKTAGYFAGQSEEWSDPENGVPDGVPIRYLCQATHCLLVTEWKVWDLAVLVAGQRFVGPYHITLDDELANMLIARETEFWDRVVGARAALAAGVPQSAVELQFAPTKIKPEDYELEFEYMAAAKAIHAVIEQDANPIDAVKTIQQILTNTRNNRPLEAAQTVLDEYFEATATSDDPDAADRTLDAISQILKPFSTKGRIEATPEIIKVFDELMELRAEAKSVESAIEDCKLVIGSYMGAYDTLVADKETLVLYRYNRPRETFDSKAHKKMAPDCHARHAGVGKAPRPFIPKEPK